MTRRLLLVRHGQTGPEYKGRFRGRIDVPLGQEGLQQVAALGRKLSSVKIDAAFSSPLIRARQTADAIGLGYEILPDLREVDFGQWDGLTFKEIATRWPGEVDKWARYDLDFAFPNGESLAEFTSRIAGVADELASRDDDTVLAVAHGGVIRAMICHLLDLSPQNYLLFHVKLASITELEIHPGGKGVLAGLSDICHLESEQLDG